MSVAAACTTERERPDSEPATGNVHPLGILDKASDDFHGRELARRGYDFGVCAECHGDDFSGGKARVSCNNCHTEGVTACTTCHQSGPTSGNHGVHRAASFDCAECHVVPDRWDAPGHLGAVEVTFGALAAKNGAPTFANGECSVYCHGNTKPRWDATPTGGCDTCHGAPPPSHARSDCASCHPSGKHVDGTMQVNEGCDSCHGRNGDPAPPRDLAGNEFTTALGVGAHQAHLRAPSGIRVPIACSECHAVPSTTTSPGHIDSLGPAEVDASLSWNRTSQTCATAWCHGPATPKWTEQGGAFCGSCHGIPPAGHAPTSTCTSCHPFELGKHIDGVLDVF